MNKIKELQLNFKYVYWILIPIILIVCFNLSFFIYEIYNISVLKDFNVYYLLYCSFILLSFSYLIMALYSIFDTICNDSINIFSIKTLKIFIFTCNCLSFTLILSLIISLILISAFLLSGTDIPYEQFKIFFILSIFAILPTILLFFARVYYSKAKVYKKVVNPTLVYSFLLTKLDFYFFNKNYKKYENDVTTKNNNLFLGNKVEILVGDILNFPDENTEELYRIYKDTIFSKFDFVIRNWFVVFIIFLWSSFISLFATIIDWIITNKEHLYTYQISWMLFIYFFVLLVLCLCLNNFSNTNNYQVIKEDNERLIKDKINKININVLSKNLELNDKNLIFILGVLRKIILYVGVGYKENIFCLTTNKNLKIIDPSKILFLKININDGILDLYCWYSKI